MSKKLIPYIEADYSWSWYCPVRRCFSRNEIERDGDGFSTPLKCEKCGKEFEEYEYDN